MTITDDAIVDAISRFLHPLSWLEASRLANEILLPLQFLMDLLTKGLDVPVLGWVLLPLVVFIVVAGGIAGFLLMLLIELGSIVLVALATDCAVWVAHAVNTVLFVSRAIGGS